MCSLIEESRTTSVLLQPQRYRRRTPSLLVKKSRIAEDDNNLTSRTGYGRAGKLRLATKPEHIETFEVCSLLRLHLALLPACPVMRLRVWLSSHPCPALLHRAEDIGISLVQNGHDTASAGNVSTSAVHASLLGLAGLVCCKMVFSCLRFRSVLPVHGCVIHSAAAFIRVML